MEQFVLAVAPPIGGSQGKPQIFFYKDVNVRCRICVMMLEGWVAGQIG